VRVGEFNTTNICIKFRKNDFSIYTYINNLKKNIFRYCLEKNINHSMTNNMKTLISELSDVECKYKLASQLGFKDIVEEMLNNLLVGSYLKDTIWKKGYTS